MKRKSVFLVHGYETGNGMHSVHFGSNFNRPSNTRNFKSLAQAKSFARSKAISQGNKTYLADLPSGSKNINVTLADRKIKRRENVSRNPFATTSFKPIGI